MVADLNRDHRISLPHGGYNVAHSSNNSNLHFVDQPEIVQAGLTENEAHSPIFERLELIQDRGSFASQFYAIRVEADRTRQILVLKGKGQESFCQLIFEELLARLAHSVVIENDYKRFRIVHSFSPCGFIVPDTPMRTILPDDDGRANTTKLNKSGTPIS
jgi:hypothetical protein